GLRRAASSAELSRPVRVPVAGVDDVLRLPGTVVDGAVVGVVVDGAVVGVVVEGAVVGVVVAGGTVPLAGAGWRRSGSPDDDPIPRSAPAAGTASSANHWP